MSARILVIENNREICENIGRRFKEKGWECDFAYSISEAQESLREKDYAVAVVDLGLPHLPSQKKDDLDGGFKVLKCAERNNPLCRCIVLTGGSRNAERIIRSMESGAYSWVQKSGPYGEELVSKVEKAKRHYELENGVGHLMQQYSIAAGCPLDPLKPCSYTKEITDGYDKNRVFVAIPVRGYSDQKKVIENTLNVVGLEAFIEVATLETGIMLCNICRNIRIAKYAVIDITSLRPNLLYELGLMHALCRKVAILFQEKSAKDRFPTDLKGLEYVGYKAPKNGSLLDNFELGLCRWINNNVPEANKDQLANLIVAAEKRIAEAANA